MPDAVQLHDGEAPSTDNGGLAYAPLVTPGDSGEANSDVSQPPEIRRFGSIDFYQLILTHQLWFFLPVLFHLIPASLAWLWFALPVVAVGVLASCWWSFSKRMAVLAPLGGATFPHRKSKHQLATHTLQLILFSLPIYFIALIQDFTRATLEFADEYEMDPGLCVAIGFGAVGVGFVIFALVTRCVGIYAISGVENTIALAVTWSIVYREAMWGVCVPFLCVLALGGQMVLFWVYLVLFLLFGVARLISWRWERNLVWSLLPTARVQQRTVGRPVSIV
ncbi:unnamed protein product [Vitrella brassicaformis CCMP3155]|uniref:Transmembrane protein n=2 Tax=Vitrella brassicaformis TaxID=1169539 RepID=A0A0G4FDL6_VITBC|nr:unnamed protein product [Vitrella brassicaformis CCMP3155]|mmetsp:Transcript_35631/g.88646  ORF Transcript_35631/g.88646 Transcript_35631/m.88646 type:complete len:278 (+) Transcript_35631:75-908(+)|eukprot:CEM11038.1 unnamed protein product [Vitrella brassicaformis CCMP3155]